ncbi:MAG: glycosyltransferase [Gemmatimonadota bacterium]
MSGTKPALAYVLDTFPGITETFIIRELQSLRERGFEVIVCAVRRPDLPDIERSLISEELLSNTMYARPDRLGRHLWTNIAALLRSPSRYLGALRVFIKETPKLKPYDIGRVLFHFCCGIGFVEELRARKVRHLHAHFVAGSNMALAAHLYDGISFSFTAHASGDIYRNAILLEKKMERAALVFPVCDYNLRYLNSLTGYRYGSKLHRVYNSVDVSEALRLVGDGTVSHRGDGRGGPGRILSVGSLLRMKGHATLIRACRQLRDGGYDLRCEIIGEGPERAVLERLIRDAELGGTMTLRGAQPLREVYASMMDADIFVLLSEIDVDGYRDALPTVILEAMGQGLPVVSTWVSGIPEMVADGTTGFLVPERDSEKAADSIAALLDDVELRRSMGAAGMRKLHEEFNPETIADLRFQLLDGLVGRGNLDEVPGGSAR